MIIATTMTHDQAIRIIGQLRLDEASLVMIIRVPRNTHKAGVHGWQIIIMSFDLCCCFFIARQLPSAPVTSWHSCMHSLWVRNTESFS